MAYKRKYVKKAVYKRKSKKRVSLRREIVRMSESKSICAEPTAVALAGNTIYSISPSQLIVQGVTNEQRIGDAVYLQSLIINGSIDAPATSVAALRYRLIVLYSNNVTANTTFVNGVLGVTNLMLNGTGSIPINGQINPNAVTVLADTIIDINSTTATSRDVKSFAMTVPLNRNFYYSPRTSTLGKTRNLFFVCMPYKVASTVDCGAINFSLRLKFKDM